MERDEHYDDSNSEDEVYDSDSSYSEEDDDELDQIPCDDTNNEECAKANTDTEDTSESEEDSADDIDETRDDTATQWVKGNTFVAPLNQCTHKNAVLSYGDLTKESTPLEIFRHFLTDGLMEDIRHQTNIYADRMKSANAKGMKKWTDVSTSELWIFLGLEVLMGLHKKPSYHDYWSKDRILRTPIFGESMSRDRFLLILRSLHFVDNSLPNVKSDRLNKLGSLLPSLMNSFKQFIEPGQYLSLDESLLLHKGRLSFQQYIPSKRARFGVKFFVLVDQETKFVICMIPYTGKGTNVSQEMVAKLGYGGGCVATMTEHYWGSYRTVVVDNYFNSPVLADFLLTKQTYVLGTVRKNRKDMPKMTGKLKKGDVEVFHTSNKVVERWCDRRDVHMLNTCLEHEMVAVPPKRPRKDSNSDDVRMKPASVMLYNSKMGGVDDVDRQIQPYTAQRKTIKWYRKVAFHLIDIAVYNSFMVFKSFRKDEDRHQYKSFLLSLVREILSNFELKRKKIGRPSLASASVDKRLEGLHFPVPNNTTDGQVSRVGCYLCKLNGRYVRTQSVCMSCKQPLCMHPPKIVKKGVRTTVGASNKSCFEQFHTLQVLPSK